MRLAIVLLAVLGACVDFDREDQVTDLRILAVELDTPEVLYSPLLVFAPPSGGGPATDIGVDVMAADPRGGTLKVSLRVCPEDAADEACDDFDDSAIDEMVAGLPEADQEAARLALLPAAVSVAVGESTDGDSHQGVGAGAVGLTRAHFDVALPPALVRALLPSGPDGAPGISLTSSFPRFDVVVENPEETGVNREVAIKRLSLSLNTADPALPAAAIAPLLTAFGVEACSAEAEARPALAGVADCLRAPTANENPQLLGFVFDRDEDGVFTDEDSDGDGAADVSPDVGVASIIRLSAGEQVRIDPVITRASFALYQGFRLDVESSTQVLENRTEDLAIEWFATSGDVGPATTSQQAGFAGAGNVRLGTNFTPRSNAAAGDLDSIIVVVHDQRGGVAVGQIEVEYR